jgi:SAM-dependent methyltransferase
MQSVEDKMNPYRQLRYWAWNISMLGLARGPHITRYFMYERLQSIGPKLASRGGRVLSVSHSENLADLVGLEPSEIVAANYPESSFLSLPFENESFDYVLSDQVLEHIEGNPQQAIDETYRVLRPGGIAIHTTCFINPIHRVPKDFWRFTPEALSLLHSNWGDVIEVDGWGNLQVWSVARDGIRYAGVPHAQWHPLHKLAIKNDPAWPIVTWIVARK